MDAEGRVRQGIGRLGNADAGELLTLQLAAWVTELHANPGVHIPPLHEGLDEVRNQLGDPAQIIWGLREGGRLIATARTSPAGPATAYLGRLGVVPDLVGQGLGSAMLRYAESMLPDDVRRIELVTGAQSRVNHRLYARHGYVMDGPGPAPGTLRMTKAVRREARPALPGP